MPSIRLPALAGMLLALLGLAGTATASAAPRHVSHGVLAAGTTAAQRAAVLTQLTGLSASEVTSVDTCPAPQPGKATCAAHMLVLRSDHAPVRPHVRSQHALAAVVPAQSTGAAAALAASAGAAQAAPADGTPAWLQQAYDLTALSATGGTGDTVGIVDAFGDPTAASDLAQFRSRYGLSACTVAGGCLRIVDQTGQPVTAQTGLTPDTGWDQEQALDLAAVSALCPNCHIVLVEANSDSSGDLLAAQQTAATLGVNQISDSWMMTTSNNTSATGTFTFPGISTIASTGDNGTYASGTNAYPAALPGVTAAGGTTLTAASSGTRGFAESAWSGAGSGCATAETKPAYQTDPSCGGRAYADVSADADPNTGLAIDATAAGGWAVFGGTSLAAPLIAAYEAVTGVDGTTPTWAYSDAGVLNDPVSGSNGSCQIVYICTATAGYDGPTGEGSISGAVVAGAPGIGGPTVNGGGYVQQTDDTSAALAGGVYPNSEATSYWWEYGPTTAYGQQTAATAIGAGSAAVPVSSTLTGLTAASTYHYRLVAQNAAGTTYGYDYTFTTAASTPPQNTLAPAISGTATQGQTLTAATGTWSPSGTVSYQWQRNAGAGWQDIAGGTAASYTLSDPADVGASIDVQVTETDGAGSTIVTSAAVGPVASAAPQNTAPPRISGIMRQGQTLTATTGTWSAWDVPTFGYQWQRSTDGGITWTAIPGATSQTYVPGVDDLAAELSVTVSAQDAYGTGSATSAATVAVASGAPSAYSPPQIIGVAARDVSLTLSTGGWSPRATSFTYQWRRSTDHGVTWTAIPGATTSSYTPVLSDEGAILDVSVSGVNRYGAGPSTTTASSTTVAPSLPSSTSPPAVGGNLAIGQTLTASPGVWLHSGTLTYRWRRSAGTGWQDIAGATSATYTVSDADNGARLTVAVTDTNPDGAVTTLSPLVMIPYVAPPSAPTSPPPTSVTAPTSPIAIPVPSPITSPSVVSVPSITGRLQVGTTVGVAGGSYTGASGATVRFEGCAWTCVWLPGSGSTLRLTTADAGLFLRAQVTVTGPGGNTTVDTPLVGPVLAPTAGVAAPGHRRTAIHGRAGQTLATATLTPARAHAAAGRTPVAIAFARPRGLTGQVRVWACVVGQRLACTAARPLRGRVLVTLPNLRGRIELIAVRGR